MRFLMFNLLLFCLPLLSISYLALCSAESDAKPQTRTPKLLNSSDIIRIKSLAFDTVLKLSPDREYLAYTVANPERKSISLPRTAVRYHSETHNPPTWRPEHRVDAWERIIGWFEKYLK